MSCRAAQDGWVIVKSSDNTLRREWQVALVFLLQEPHEQYEKCWRRLLRVPWTARRSNQSILKEINPEYSLIGRTDAETEFPILCSSDKKSLFIGKDPDPGKD